ncbi:MAG: hypothetical protein LE169_06045 [Endomicrobium sp.]|nr:hypothetical protein [Endomicrobium sp.]
MKKIICICICICLTSGCDKSLRHGSPVNAVTEDKAPHSLTSDTPNASASEPSNTPAPTPEPSKSAQPSDSADTGSSVVKIGAFVLSVIAVYGGYKLLYRFADLESASSRPNYRFPDLEPASSRHKDKFCTRVKLSEVSDDGHYLRDGIRECIHEYVSFYSPKSYFFDKETKEYIDEIPFMVNDDIFYYYYIPKSSKLKSLKIWLRKILRIPTNYSALIKKI